MSAHSGNINPETISYLYKTPGTRIDKVNKAYEEIEVIRAYRFYHRLEIYGISLQHKNKF